MTSIDRGLDGVDLKAGGRAGRFPVKMGVDLWCYRCCIGCASCVCVKIRVDSLPTGRWDFVGCGRGFVHAVAIIAIISRSVSLLGCLGFEGFEMGAAP